MARRPSMVVGHTIDQTIEDRRPQIRQERMNIT